MKEVILAQHRRIEELERRLANQERPGVVHSVDPKAGTVRLRLGGTDGDPFLSPPIPYEQTMGALKIHSPPSVGQQMIMHSPNGEPRQATARPFTSSDANKSPSDAGDEHVLTIGSVKLRVKGDSVNVETPTLSIKAGGSTWELTDGSLKVKADNIEATGTAMKHNGKPIDDTHRHTGVMPGPALTGPPA